MRMLTASPSHGVPKRGGPDPAAAYLQRLAPGSRRAIGQALDRFAQAVTGREDALANDLAWASLRRADVDAARASLAQTLAPATVNKLLSAVRGVVREAHRLGLLSKADADAILAVPWTPPTPCPPQAERSLSRTLTHHEVVKLFAACATNDRPSLRRDAAVLAILLATGLRRAELAALRLSDYDPRQRTLTLSSQPDKRRIVALPPPAAAAMHAWLEARGARPGPLFPPVGRGGRVGSRFITDQAVYDIVRRLGRRAGVDDLNSRCLRRTCAVAMIAAGRRIEDVQRHLGHATWVTTAVYAELAAETASAINLAALPYYPPPHDSQRHHSRRSSNRARRPESEGS